MTKHIDTLMEISDGHESLFSEISTDGSFESGDSDVSKDDFCLIILESQNIKRKN